jgi:hypothetical protein
MRGDPEAMPAQAAVSRRAPEANLFIIRGFRFRVKPSRSGSDVNSIVLKAGGCKAAVA